METAQATSPPSPLNVEPFWDAPGHPAASVTLRQAVVRLLRADIVNGSLPPGMLLRETALSKRLGISATPIREAIGTLASEGLVEVEAHRLKRVTPIDLAGTSDLIRVQAELWRLGYLWGMPRVGAAQLARIDQAISRYRTAIGAGEHMAAINASLDFHAIFIMASKNRELLRSTLDRRGLLARFIFLHGRHTLSEAGLWQHQSILDAFTANDHAQVLSGLDRMAKSLLALCDSPRTSIMSKD